ELALAREGVFAPVLEGLVPVANQVLVDAQRAGGLSEGIALLGHKLDGLVLELRGVSTSFSYHEWTSKGEYTLLTECPLFVGRSNRISFLLRQLPCWEQIRMLYASRSRRKARCPFFRSSSVHGSLLDANEV